MNIHTLYEYSYFYKNIHTLYEYSYFYMNIHKMETESVQICSISRAWRQSYMDQVKALKTEQI
jgi:hypothetical protein